MLGAAGKSAVATGVLLVATLSSAAPVSSKVEAAVITLPTGVNGADIQSALDSLPATGGEVILPRGKIEVRDPIVLRREHQTLRGFGNETVLFLVDQANCPVIILGEPVNHPRKVIRSLRVSDLFIDGNRTHQQRELWHWHGEGSQIRNNGITVQSVSDSAVEHVIIARCRSGGLVTTLGVTRLTVTGLESFDNQFDGLACYHTAESRFTQLDLHDNRCAGISLDLAFTHNVIRHARLTRNDLGIFMRSSHNNQFQDVTISDSHDYGVFMAHTDLVTSHGVEPAPHSACVQNSFTNLMASNCGSAAFRVNNTTCVDNVLVDPRFENNANGGLSLVRPGLVIVQ